MTRCASRKIASRTFTRTSSWLADAPYSRVKRCRQSRGQPPMLSPDKLTVAVNADRIDVPGGLAQLTTPALVLDLERFRANQAHMMSLCRAAGIKLRPHGKTHKCSRLAFEPVAAGAVGICCATPHEAIAFARAGVGKQLITSPVVQPRHLRAL